MSVELSYQNPWYGDSYQITLRAPKNSAVVRSWYARYDFHLTARNQKTILQKKMIRRPQDRTHDCESLRAVPYRLLPYREGVEGIWYE
jgi:hypothetical protein